MIPETVKIASAPRVESSSYAPIARALDLVHEGGAGSLWDPQAEALGALALFGGVVAQLGCGDGKGLVSMLGPLVCGSKRPLVLIPGKLRSTFYAEAAKFKALGFKIPRTLEVRSHGFISRNSTWLDEYRPDFIFIDEAHAYRNPDSARTMRLLRYLEANPTRARGGEIVFGVASGTLVASSILDCAHLMTHALGDNSPLPQLVNPRAGISSELASWANCLDPGGQPQVADWFVLRSLVREFAPALLDEYIAGGYAAKQRIARTAYDQRRRCMPGVVVSDAESCKVPLTIHTRPNPEPPREIEHALALVEAGLDPLDGTPFDDESAQWRAAQQLSIGCFYRWNWSLVGRTSPDEEWLDVRSRWARAVSTELRERAAPNFDSPGYIEAAVEADIESVYTTGAEPLLARLHRPYLEWRSMRTRYDLDELREIVWLAPFFVRDVAASALLDPKPAVVWYHSEGAERALRAAGLPVYGAGSETPDEPITCAMSMRRHGTGTNLQDRWATCYFAEFPTSGELAEQVLSRLHRAGQREPVTAHVYTHTSAFRRNLRTARERAEFLSWAQGRQRLAFAEFETLKTGVTTR